MNRTMASRICKTLISLPFTNTVFVNLHKPLISSSIRFALFSSSTSEAALGTPSSIPHPENPEKFESVLSFFEENGFSKSQVEQILKKMPLLLNSKLDRTFKPKFQVFQDIGFEQEEIADIVAEDPWLLKKRLAPSISVLKTVLGSRDNVCKALRISTRFLKHDLEKTMLPNIELLKSCGVSSSQIEKLVYNYPLVLLNKPENLRETVKRVDELGFSRESNMYIYAVQVLKSLSREKWETKLECFRSLGLTEDQILSAFKKFPPAFTKSESKIEEFGKVLLNRDDVDASFIAKHPYLLAFGIKKYIEPRLMVYDVLESKNVFKKKPNLANFLKIPSAAFISRYVLPYADELGDVSKLFKTHV